MLTSKLLESTEIFNKTYKYKPEISSVLSLDDNRIHHDVKAKIRKLNKNVVTLRYRMA